VCIESECVFVSRKCIVCVCVCVCVETVCVSNVNVCGWKFNVWHNKVGIKPLSQNSYWVSLSNFQWQKEWEGNTPTTPIGPVTLPSGETIGPFNTAEEFIKFFVQRTIQVTDRFEKGDKIRYNRDAGFANLIKPYKKFQITKGVDKNGVRQKEGGKKVTCDFNTISTQWLGVNMALPIKFRINFTVSIADKYIPEAIPPPRPPGLQTKTEFYDYFITWNGD